MLVRRLVGQSSEPTFVTLYLNSQLCPMGYDVHARGEEALKAHTSVFNGPALNVRRDAIKAGAPSVITALVIGGPMLSGNEQIDWGTWLRLQTQHSQAAGLRWVDHLLIGTDYVLSMVAGSSAVPTQEEMEEAGFAGLRKRR